MTPHPVKLIQLAKVAREGRYVATSGKVALVYHPVQPPVYRGLFRDTAA